MSKKACQKSHVYCKKFTKKANSKKGGTKGSSVINGGIDKWSNIGTLKEKRNAHGAVFHQGIAMIIGHDGTR